MRSTTDRRRRPRVKKSLPVEVRFLEEGLSGESANVSFDGVYFVAKGPLTVEVVTRTGGRAMTLRGRLVRIESHDASGGELGVAIRFDVPETPGSSESRIERG